MEVASRQQRGTGSAVDVGTVAALARNQWCLLVGQAEPVAQLPGADDPPAGGDVLARDAADAIESAVRAAPAGSTSPVAALGRAEAALTRAAPGHRASAVLARLELDRCGAWATIACAGDPRVMVVRRAGWVDVRGQGAALLGAPGGPGAAEDRVGLGPGDALVLYSAGVTGARDGRGEAFGDEGLPTALLAYSGRHAEALARCVIEGVRRHAGGRCAEGASVLVVRVPEEAADDPDARLEAALGEEADRFLPSYPVGEPHWGHRDRPSPPREARITLPPEAPSAGAARRFVDGVLHSWRMSALAGGDAALIASELSANAVEHGGSRFTVVTAYDGARVRIGVGDGSRVLPEARPRIGDAVHLRGRGLLLVDALAADWGVAATVDGKRVWAEVEVPPDPAPG